MIEADAKAALLGHLDNVPISPAIPVARPNVHYEPSIGQPYLRASFMSVETVQPGLSDEDTERHRGILQISVFYPKGGAPGVEDGTVQPTRLAATVRQHFPRGLILDADGVRVDIGPAPSTVETEVPEDAWFHVPVTIHWQAFVRPA
jgi:hypothetical protein